MTYTVDKREVAVVGVNTAIMFISFLVVVYINVNRAYIPLKCKNIPLINVLYATMFLWFIGDIYTYQPSLVQASRPICIATMSWLRMSLGIFSVISCHLLRIYQYQCVFQWRIRATGKHLWIPIALWTVLPLTYGILASVLPEDKGNSYVTDPPMCIAEKPVYFVAVAFTVILMLFWVYATVLMRRVNVCFNEYRELLVVIISTIFVVLMQVVLRWIPAIGETGFAYNTLASMSDVLIGQISLFLLIYKPTYHCVANKEDYLKYFLRTLKRENRQTEYELANGEEMAKISSSFSGRKSYSGLGHSGRLHRHDRSNVRAEDGSMTGSTKSLAKVLYGGCPEHSDSDSAFRDVFQLESPNRMLV
ncbi:hypothetical protein IWW39_001758 [Coemansia spiralis]|uniref:Uncharacterized protein n=1 Tax=Coemansia spiralis TaxID=417178 RepID=A0A9W8L5X4_9FUNG|nr:hypothetical protein IWW39_001758 [Coemansia spiralis]